MSHAYRILDRKRSGERLTEIEIQAAVQGATDGSWTDAELAAFLMAAAIRGLDARETRALTLAMLESGERWDLAASLPAVGDKHSTGGVGDKVSLILAPLLAACGQPVVMLTGRSLGHTGGTADKLESIPGIDLELDRRRTLQLLEETGMAIGVATAEIAPADRRLYSLRDATGTVSSLPLVTASILSKKLATGAAGIVFDVKTGNGAVFSDRREAVQLARLLVEISDSLDRPARALVTDMSQPLGLWVGHSAEVQEALECLSGRGEARLMELTLGLCEELAQITGLELSRADLETVIANGAARERFELWAAAQGALPSWLQHPRFDLAPQEVVLEAPREGVLNRLDTRQLGLLMLEAGGGRSGGNGLIDHGVALRLGVCLGARVGSGQELCRLYLRRIDDALIRALRSCFRIDDTGQAPDLVVERVVASS